MCRGLGRTGSVGCECIQVWRLCARQAGFTLVELVNSTEWIQGTRPGFEAHWMGVLAVESQDSACVASPWILVQNFEVCEYFVEHWTRPAF